MHDRRDVREAGRQRQSDGVLSQSRERAGPQSARGLRQMVYPKEAGMTTMRYVAIFTLAAAPLSLPLCAQSWDPKMPDAVPAASGKVVEAATFRYIDVKP